MQIIEKIYGSEILIKTAVIEDTGNAAPIFNLTL